tara:strand:- start:2602 stop:3222 length:621 start_codon:yes stop_codon:yes gene_type:complete
VALFRLPEFEQNASFWCIDESEKELINKLSLSVYFRQKFETIKSTQQRKQFLAVHMILKSIQIDQNSLSYNQNGKPILNNGQYISISHSHDYCGVAIGESKLGLDIEKLRPKIFNISSKFLHKKEVPLIKKMNIENLTKVWTIKESVFKAFGHTGLSFKDNIKIIKTDNEFLNASVEINFENKIETYRVDITTFSQYICSIASKMN